LKTVIPASSRAYQGPAHLSAVRSRYLYKKAALNLPLIAPLCLFIISEWSGDEKSCFFLFEKLHSAKQAINMQGIDIQDDTVQCCEI